MNKKLIIYPSWESRSYGGFLRDLENIKITDVILVRNDTHHCEKSKIQIEQIEKKCEEQSISIQYIEINHDAVRNWKNIGEGIDKNVRADDNILIDITTMSRNVVWSILYFLRSKVKNINVVYHQPQSYTKDWISREPEQPMLLFKHSGIYDLGKETTLILITGYDEERTKYMLYKYEPQKVYLLVQEGEQFNNKQRNDEAAHRAVCEDFGLSKDNILSKQIDSYSPDFGFEVVESVIKEENQSNVILASFGPKPSAISAYRCYMQHPEIALCYLPCKDYNIDYCQGIGESLNYTLNFSKEDA